MLPFADTPSVLSSPTDPEAQGRPHVLLIAAPWFSHVNNLRIIALDLVRRGYEVTFMTGSVFKDTVDETGATFVSLSGNADFDGSKVKEFLPEWGTKGGTVEQIERDFHNIFITRIAAQHASIQTLLRDMSRRGKGPVVLLHDTLFLGTLPIVLGAPGIRPPIVCLGIPPLMKCSIDRAPFGTGLPPDNTGIGRSRNAEMTSAAKQALVSLTTAYTQAMQKLGVTKTTGYVFDDMVISLDRYLQLSIRDLEYLRSDLREGLKFVGRVPTGLRGDSGLPPWWGLIVANKKPLVVVSQGTLSNEPEDLTIPAIEGLRELDVLVVATLVLDPLRKLFLYADVVINNGGYGTINLALSLGVPLVLAGLSEDKKEANAPVREAVQEILKEPRYKARALKLQAEYGKCDSLGDIAATIDEMGKVGAKL